jgi:hypothetical protein
MEKIIKHFGLDAQGYTQHNVEFLDLYLGIDNKLFFDYNKILQGNSTLYGAMRADINVFMKSLFTYLANNKNSDLSILLDGLHETNATHLGLSKGKPRGKSVGNELKEKIFENLHFLKKALAKGNLEIDSIYFGIENIGPDRISDIVTSIIKSRLILFTQQQCIKHSILMHKVAVNKIFNSRTAIWESKFVELPIYQNEPVILIPKDIVSTYDGISGTFHAFVSYGFHNFFKASNKYKKLVRGKDGSLDDDLKRNEFDEYNKDNGLNNKAISQKMLTEFENNDVVNAFFEIRKNVRILSNDELIEIIENNLRKAN